MFSNLITPFFEFAKEEPGTFLGLFLLLTVGFTAAFARRNTLTFFWGLTKIMGRILVAPVRFISQYTALTHGRADADALPWISRRAPLTMANLSFVSSFTAFSGILLLAATVLLAGKALLPDPNIGREIKSVIFQKDISQSEQANAQSLLARIKAAGTLDQMGRNGVYAEVGKSWITLLREEQGKLKEEIESDASAKAELARAEKGLPSVSNLDYYMARWDRYRFQIKDAYYRNLINVYVSLNARIEKSRSASAPVIYDWENASRYQEMLSRWETTAKNDPSEPLTGELLRLRELNHFNWSSMLLVLAMGLVFTWFWIWLCGVCVESMDLLLGHLEWVKQLQEDSRNRVGKS